MSSLGRPLAMPVLERRQLIFAQAERLFGEHGYEKVTMADIAAACGMSKKTLYVHFSDKACLLKALIGSSYSWPYDAVACSEAPLAHLRTVLEVMLEHVLSARHIKLCRLAIGESVSFAGLAHTFYQSGLNASRQALVEAIERVPKTQQLLNLSAPIQADMLFGALCGEPLFAALLEDVPPDIEAGGEKITPLLAALFKA